MNDSLESGTTAVVNMGPAGWPEHSDLRAVRAHFAALTNGTRSTYRTVKRGMDIVVSLLTIIVMFPLLLMTALLIKMWDGGPVLHWQKRVGKNGVEFPFPKFRSMRVDAEAMRKELELQNHHGDDGVTFKIKDDPRITPVGRLIRKTSIDELPQLWCVFKGDMALVGPRPPLPSEVMRYQGMEFGRLRGVPGLTCYWQIQGRANLPFVEQVRLDLKYLEEQSILTDIKILLKTVPVVITGKGAY